MVRLLIRLSLSWRMMLSRFMVYHSGMTSLGPCYSLAKQFNVQDSLVSEGNEEFEFFLHMDKEGAFFWPAVEDAKISACLHLMHVTLSLLFHGRDWGAFPTSKEGFFSQRWRKKCSASCESISHKLYFHRKGRIEDQVATMNMNASYRVRYPK